MATYIERSLGDTVLALDLYRANLWLASSLWVPIAHIEIAFRNRLLVVLQRDFGEAWFRSRHIPSRIRAEVERNLRVSNLEDIHPDELNRRIASQLGLGFWCQLLDSEFEKDLWVKALHTGFAPKVSRKTLLHEINEMRLVRNRIAHHEHLLNLDAGRFLERLAVLADLIEPGYSKFVLGEETKPEA